MICFKCLSLKAIRLSIDPSGTPEHGACGHVGRSAYLMCVPMRHVESMAQAIPPTIRALRSTGATARDRSPAGPWIPELAFGEVAGLRT